MVENDNDADTGTNAGRVKGEFSYSYFVRQVYVFRYPTAHSHPCKLTREILALSVVKTFLILGCYATSLGTYNVITYGGLAWHPEFGWLSPPPHQNSGCYLYTLGSYDVRYLAGRVAT